MMGILELVSAVGTVASTGNSIIQLINHVKPLLKEEESNPFAFQGQPQAAAWSDPRMQPFHPQQSNPFGQGQQWVPQLEQMAQSHGNGWVPQRTQPLYQFSLTGVWCSPPNWNFQTYIRQFGPYINLVAGIGGQVAAYAEGLLNPTNWCIYIVGYEQNMPVEIRAQVYSNWTIQGTKLVPGQFGQPTFFPFMIGRIA